MLNGYLSKYFEEENVSICNKYRTSILTSQNDTYTEHISQTSGENQGKSPNRKNCDIGVEK